MRFNPSNFFQLHGAIGNWVYTTYVGIFIVPLLNKLIGVIASHYVIGEKAHGVEGLAFIVVAPDSRELVEVGSGVWFHGSNIDRIGWV